MHVPTEPALQGRRMPLPEEYVVLITVVHVIFMLLKQ